MVEVTLPRAQMVEALWQLKQLSEQYADAGLGTIHFNALLKKPHYRREVIQRALNNRVPAIRRLAEALSDMDTQEVLVRRSAPAHAAENRDITDTQRHREQQSAAPGPAGRRLLWTLGALLALVAVTIAAVVLEPAAYLRSQLWGREIVAGSLSGKQHWTADRQWVLDGIVYVEAGAQLEIDAGTQILGRKGSALVVTRDATLYARGTSTAPIVFTSAQPEGTRQAGDWGGLVLLGSAPINQSEARIEGVPEDDSRGAFGGRDSESNCGVLEYVRIEFAGYEAYADNELNGLTLGGCGSHTIVRNVQVHRALDDGVEVFGGTVDLKNLLITGAADDSLDWDMGWRGRVQFLIVQQYPGVGDNAFEGDNRKGNPDAMPISEPQFNNVTLISPQSGEKYQRAMTLRRGTGGHFNNVIIQGFSGEAIDLRDAETVARIEQGRLSFDGVIISDIGRGGRRYFEPELAADDDDAGFDERAYFDALETVAIGGDPGLLPLAGSLQSPSYTSIAASDVEVIAVPVPQGEFWDESAQFAGAIRPGSNSPWPKGWTAFPVH